MFDTRLILRRLLYTANSSFRELHSVVHNFICFYQNCITKDTITTTLPESSRAYRFWSQQRLNGTTAAFEGGQGRSSERSVRTTLQIGTLSAGPAESLPGREAHLRPETRVNCLRCFNCALGVPSLTLNRGGTQPNCVMQALASERNRELTGVNRLLRQRPIVFLGDTAAAPYPHEARERTFRRCRERGGVEQPPTTTAPLPPIPSTAASHCPITAVIGGVFRFSRDTASACRHSTVFNPNPKRC